MAQPLLPRAWRLFTCGARRRALSTAAGQASNQARRCWRAGRVALAVSVGVDAQPGVVGQQVHGLDGLHPSGVLATRRQSTLADGAHIVVEAGRIRVDHRPRFIAEALLPGLFGPSPHTQGAVGEVARDVCIFRSGTEPSSPLAVHLDDLIGQRAGVELRVGVALTEDDVGQGRPVDVGNAVGGPANRGLPLWLIFFRLAPATGQPGDRAEQGPQQRGGRHSATCPGSRSMHCCLSVVRGWRMVCHWEHASQPSENRLLHIVHVALDGYHDAQGVQRISLPVPGGPR